MIFPAEKLLTCALFSMGKVCGLYRHACKGLSADSLNSVSLKPGDTFPDDRRYALLKIQDGSFDDDDGSKPLQFDPENPEWLHKANFLCAFSAPELMAKFEAKYDHDTKHLSLWQRSHKAEPPVLDAIDMSTCVGREQFADFFSRESGLPLTCITAATEKHQFGNTSSGWKQKKDTRTIHIINAATVRELSSAIGIPLNPTRFRPNIVIDGIEPWAEFEWVKNAEPVRLGSVSLEVIARTVRCEGVSIDPLEHPHNVIDIPKQLVKHFPEHGPYLGVYAVVKEGGSISIGDEVQI
jgi:uncharacterized protein YcbX